MRRNYIFIILVVFSWSLKQTYPLLITIFCVFELLPQNRKLKNSLKHWLTDSFFLVVLKIFVMSSTIYMHAFAYDSDPQIVSCADPITICVAAIVSAWVIMIKTVKRDFNGSSLLSNSLDNLQNSSPLLLVGTFYLDT